VRFNKINLLWKKLAWCISWIKIRVRFSSPKIAILNYKKIEKKTHNFWKVYNSIIFFNKKKSYTSLFILLKSL
jgi:hypothetical protein